MEYYILGKGMLCGTRKLRRTEQQKWKLQPPKLKFPKMVLL